MTTVDYEGTRKEAFIPRPDAEHYNLVATFPTPAAADRAVEELHRHGFTSADVRVMGSPEDAVVNGNGMTQHDKQVVASTAKWGVAGVVGGAVLGAIVGVVLMAIPAFQDAIGVHVNAASYLLAALFGAIIGSVLGVAGGILGLDRRRAGVQTYSNQTAAGPTMLGIHADDDTHARSATETLHACGAADVQWIRPEHRVVV